MTDRPTFESFKGKALKIPDVKTAYDEAAPAFAMKRNMIAMRTAMPLVTCERISDRSLSATSEAISRPRFIGPGCITTASGAARFSLSIVIP